MEEPLEESILKLGEKHKLLFSNLVRDELKVPIRTASDGLSRLVKRGILIDLGIKRVKFKSGTFHQTRVYELR